MCFSNLQKKIFQKTILSLKFKFPAKNSKQQIQISSSGQFFGIFFFEIWKFEKQIALSKKKPPLVKFDPNDQYRFAQILKFIVFKIYANSLEKSFKKLKQSSIEDRIFAGMLLKSLSFFTGGSFGLKNIFKNHIQLIFFLGL